MKKILSIAALCAGLFIASSATAQVYEQGGNIIHGGIGFGSPYYVSGLTGTASYMPPVHVSFEHGLKDKIGIGGLIGYTSSSFEDVNAFYTLKTTYSYVIVGVRGAYHFYNEGKLDAYAGAMLAYNAASAKQEVSGPWAGSYKGTAASAGGVTFGAFAGARYGFTDKLMGFAELGYNIAWFSVGIGYKL